MDGARLRDVVSGWLARFGRADEGQDLLEYGLLATLISVFAVGAVTLLGNQVNVVLWQTIASNF